MQESATCDVIRVRTMVWKRRLYMSYDGGIVRMTMKEPPICGFGCDRATCIQSGLIMAKPLYIKWHGCDEAIIKKMFGCDGAISNKMEYIGEFIILVKLIVCKRTQLL